MFARIWTTRRAAATAIVLVASLVMGTACERHTTRISGPRPAPDDYDVHGVVELSDEVENLRSDPYDLRSVVLRGDSLHIQAQVSGGCLDHDFRLFAGTDFMESYPVRNRAYLVHTDPGDPCDARPTYDLAFDLRPLIDLFQEYYSEADPLIILLHPDAARQGKSFEILIEP